MSLQTRAVHLLTTPDRVEIYVRGERFATYRYAEGLMPGFVSLAAPGERLITQPNADGLGFWVGHNANTEDGRGDKETGRQGDKEKAVEEDGRRKTEEKAITNPGVHPAFRPGGTQSPIVNPDHLNTPIPEHQTPNTEHRTPNTRIVTEDMTARRGTYSVGFQHDCTWINGEGERILTDTRMIRAAPGPSEGAILDIHLRLQAPDAHAVRFGQAGDTLLSLQVASALFSSEASLIGGGQIRNSLGEYGMANLHSHLARWCAGMGVVRGETIGFVWLEHPGNSWFPSLWVARPTGLLSPTPFAWRSVKLLPGGQLSLRYRLLIHMGYVDQGWADDRLADFAREVEGN